MNDHKSVASQRSAINAHTPWVLVLVLLSIFVGCAPKTADIKPESATEKTAPEVQQLTISPLEDGRKGFVIREVVSMDETLQKDFDMAVAAFQAGDNDQAISLLEGIVAQSPEVSAPYINLAMAYERAGKAEEAESHLKTALEMVPGHPVASNTYGLLCRKAGRFDEARRLYETALEGFPEYYPAHKNLGILCDLYLNDPACALAHYQAYSEAQPEDDKVQLWIAGLRQRVESQ